MPEDEPTDETRSGAGEHGEPRDEWSVPIRREPVDVDALRGELVQTRHIPGLIEQLLESAAIIDDALAEFGVRPVVVGGLAIAYWTGGAFRTGDIDVLLPRLPEVEARLHDLGLVRQGRIWFLPGTPLIFEAPGERLDPQEQAVEVQLRSGRTLRVLSPEDMVIWRLREFVHWESSRGFHQALYLLGTVHLDRNRLDTRLREEGLEPAFAMLERAAIEIDEGRRFESWEIHKMAQELK